MISEKQKQIIRLLLTNKEGYNVNQIAKILNISVSWVYDTLKQLEKEGILKSAKKANAVFFSLNWQDKKTEKICELILLDQVKPIVNPVVNLESAKDITQIKPVYTKIAETKQNYAPSNAYEQQSSFSAQNYSSITPIGDQGVNSLLFSYAKSGAFGNASNYSTVSAPVSDAIVPPDTLGSRVSKNVSGFTMGMHTTQHKNLSVSGCRYCG